MFLISCDCVTPFLVLDLLYLQAVLLLILLSKFTGSNNPIVMGAFWHLLNQSPRSLKVWMWLLGLPLVLLDLVILTNMFLF